MQVDIHQVLLVEALEENSSNEDSDDNNNINNVYLIKRPSSRSRSKVLYK